MCPFAAGNVWQGDGGLRAFPRSPALFFCLVDSVLYLMAFEPNRTGVLTVRLLLFVAGRWCCQPACRPGRTPRSAGGLLAGRAGGRGVCCLPGAGARPVLVWLRNGLLGAAAPSEGPASQTGDRGWCSLTEPLSFRRCVLAGVFFVELPARQGSRADGRRAVCCERPRCGLSKFLALEPFPCVT